tara:strand:+ start:16548 stop:17069 length:522 start_codon:yes stop_codon:yes gene_type:complete
MGRTEIDGSQVQDETITGSDVLDESLKAVDLDIIDVATGLVGDPTAISILNDAIIFGSYYTKTKNPTFSTTSGSFVNILTFSVIADAGTYRANYGFTTTNSKANTDNICRVIVNGNQLFSREQPGDTINSVGSFDGDIIHPGGALTGSIEVRRSSGNGSAIISNTKIDIWRVL